MEFDEYLESKKIDPKKFRAGDQDQYQEFQKLFEQVHPNSFTQQKLFLINKIRRTYLLEKTDVPATTSAPKKMKPKIVVKKPKLS